ncbi:MAG: MOSC domain-containing protein [Methylobacter sp.]
MSTEIETSISYSLPANRPVDQSVEVAMKITEIWRYPVKTMAGEKLQQARIGLLGIEGDRVVHVEDALGQVITSRTHPRFLGHKGTLGPDGEPLVDNRPWNSPEVATEVVNIAGPGAKLVRYDGVERFDVLPLLIATDGAIAAFGHDRRRLRPNIVVGGVEGLAEREWPGACLRIGEVLIGVQDLRLRCIMTAYDPDTLAQDKEITRSIYRRFDGKLALNCFVIEGGEIAVDDAVQLVSGRACIDSATAAILAG